MSPQQKDPAETVTPYSCGPYNPQEFKRKRNMLLSDEIFSKTEAIYEDLAKKQEDWYKNTAFTCPQGCGGCCHDFEPELFEVEAVYLGRWLIENRNEAALEIASGEFRDGYEGKTCIFFTPDSDYHCTVYGGRPFVCRLFGASSFRGKDGEPVWRPCKFYPAEKLRLYNPGLVHRQYTLDETRNMLGECPPPMSDFMEQAVSVIPGNTSTVPLRKILPQTIRRLLFEKQLGETAES